MRIDLGTQLLFLDDGLLLVLARLASLLCRLVLELAVVHDLAHRRLGIRGYFDKVEIGIRGDAECIFDAHDAYLFTARSDQADFRYADTLVDAGLSADGASLDSSCCPQEPLDPPALFLKEQISPAQRRAQADQDRHRRCL
ncbi:hypothetical protein MPRF_38380 [Mycolicibacterium parafortuitum]|uniref:Uncharacterized protein n=1 Tax=Mycolicibacterium parafortuitum TaxID=39692 RepID=A0A7I7U8J1_MYCPF|nr:hypothetical protein MPRF_38380 [Mycolicibacterium parafortuitum]